MLSAMLRGSSVSVFCFLATKDRYRRGRACPARIGAQQAAPVLFGFFRGHYRLCETALEFCGIGFVKMEVRGSKPRDLPK